MLKWWRKPKPKEKHMNHFSQEYLEKLIAEHKLVSASIARLRGEDFNRHSRNHGAAAVSMALSTMTSRKVELEAYIDTLADYLNG
jgi:hypothetical protein